MDGGNAEYYELVIYPIMFSSDITDDQYLDEIYQHWGFYDSYTDIDGLKMY